MISTRQPIAASQCMIERAAAMKPGINTPGSTRSPCMPADLDGVGRLLAEWVSHGTGNVGVQRICRA